MIHLRVISPAHRTDALVAALETHAHVVNLAVLRNAAVRPVGDVVLIDVPNEAANSVVDLLRARGAVRDGSITIERSGTMLSAAATATTAIAPGSSSEAVVWSEIEARCRDDSELTVSFVVMLVLATAIAAVGILTDSTILIIGAMVIGPEYGPLVGLAFGWFRRKPDLIVATSRTLLAGFAAGIAITAAFAAIVRSLGVTPEAYEAGVRPLTQFISRPDGWSVVVALLAGLAGTISLTQAKPSALVGVFISVTTIPAAANVAVATAHARGDEAVGAAGQLLLNLVVIVVAGAMTFVIEHAVGRRLARRRRPLP